MKLLIIGSRSIKILDKRIEARLCELLEEGVELIISGGAKGIDTLAEQYADAHGIEKLIIRPQYDRFGRAAPIKRNEQMVDACDVVLAIWDGESRGTRYTLDYARKKGKEIIEIVIAENFYGKF